MAKNLKVILILFVALFSICSFSYATDIDMNISTSDNVIENTLNTNSNENKNSKSNAISASSNSDYTTISSVQETSTDEGLSLSNILNILLIVVGIVLILLAIAILIRLYN